MQKNSFELLVQKAKIQLFTKKIPFLTTIVLSLETEVTTSIPTAATNGLKLLLNPDFFTSLSEQERLTLLAHEAWHVGFNHIARAAKIPDVNRMKYNVAADYVINLMLDEDFEPIENWLLDCQYEDMNTEQVYNLLEDSDVPSDYVMDIQADDISQSTIKKIEDTLIKAAIQHKVDGQSWANLPMDIQRILDNLINPKLPWNILLQKYMQERTKDDYSWSRPNRKYLPDFYLPSLYTDSLQHITIAIDASGSVTEEDFAKFIAEISYIHTTSHPEKMTIIDFDTEIKSVQELDSQSDITQLKFYGGGGTDIFPVFDWAEKNKPELLIIFTDGEFEHPTKKLESNILWIIYNNPEWATRQGEVIYYD